MKIGMNFLLWADAPDFSQHARTMERLRGWGFDGVELHVNGFSLQDAKEYRKICDAAGLDISVATTYDAGDCDPLADDNQKAIDTLKHNLDKAQILGSTYVSGPLFQAIPQFSGDSPTKREWENAVRCISTGAEYAKQAGIRLSLEPINRFEMYMVNTVADAYRFVMDTGMDNVGILADTFHANIEEKDVLEAWDAVFDRIFYIHISENDRGIPGTGHAIPPGLKELLQKHGYDGWLTIEAFNNTIKGLISRLCLWRPFAASDDDIAKLGAQFIRKTLL